MTLTAVAARGVVKAEVVGGETEDADAMACEVG